MARVEAQTTAVVVGGGVFGVAGAWELRRRGYHVILLERSAACPGDGGASNDINRIVRADYGSDELYARLAVKSFKRWSEWNAQSLTETGRPIYATTGVFFMRPSPILQGTYEGDSLAVMQRLGLPAAPIPIADAVARFPAWRGLAGSDVHAYFNAEGGMAHPQRSVAWMAEQARRAGVEFRHGLSGHVVGIEQSGTGDACVRIADGTMLTADAIVVAAGPWTPYLLPAVRDKIMATGQAIVYVRVPPTLTPLFDRARFPVFTADISNTGLYGFALERSKDGTPVIKIGVHGRGYSNIITAPDGGQVSVPVQTTAPAEEVEKVMKFVRTALPDLRDATVHESRLCWYDDAWDGDFFITRVGATKNLFVAAGSSGHGFKFAPVLGDLIADAVQGKQSAEEATRFGWREAQGKSKEACRSDNSTPIPLRDALQIGARL